MIDRIHMTNATAIDKDWTYHQGKDTQHQMKPTGLWYSIGTEWLEWCSSEMPHWIKPNLYSLEVDDSDILIIDNIIQLEEFCKEYGKTVYSSLKTIDWQRVTQKYKGIELQQYHELKWNMKLSMSYTWIYGWDVNGGCIWDLDILTAQKKCKAPKEYATKS